MGIDRNTYTRWQLMMWWTQWGWGFSCYTLDPSSFVSAMFFLIIATGNLVRLKRTYNVLIPLNWKDELVARGVKDTEHYDNQSKAHVKVEGVTKLADVEGVMDKKDEKYDFKKFHNADAGKPNEHAQV